MYHLLSAKNDPKTGSPYRFNTITDILRKSGEGLEPFGIRRSNLMPENGYLIFNRNVGICGTEPLYPRGTQLRCIWIDLYHAWNQEERRLESLRIKLNEKAARRAIRGGLAGGGKTEAMREEAKRWLHSNNYRMSPAQQELLSFDTETLRIGDWPFASEPVIGRLSCRESNLKEETKVAPKNAKKAKFYTASREIGRAFANGDRHPHMHEEIEGAIKEAEASLGNDNNLDAICIVQIVRVVRRQKAPIKVEIVK